MAVADDLAWVSPSLLFWQAYDARCRTDLSSCAYIMDGQICLVDPIELSPGAIEELVLVAPLKMIVLTNGNHARAALQFKERFKIPIFAHQGFGRIEEITWQTGIDKGAGDNVRARLTHRFRRWGVYYKSSVIRLKQLLCADFR